MPVLLVCASGRLSGAEPLELSLGDVVVIDRRPAEGGDGSVDVVGSTEGSRPLLRMPPGSQVEVLDGGRAWLAPDGAQLELHIAEWQAEFPLGFAGRG
jgi:hypothetical protein